MNQCPKCKWEIAPCAIGTIVEGYNGKCCYFKPAQPWLEKWIEPEWHEILAEKCGWYYGRDTRDGGGKMWNRKTGKDSTYGVNLIPRKPRPDLKEGDPVIVWAIPGGVKFRRHFAGWTEDGMIRVFPDGGTRWGKKGNDLQIWDHYRIPTAKEFETGMIE